MHDGILSCHSCMFRGLKVAGDNYLGILDNTSNVVARIACNIFQDLVI